MQNVLELIETETKVIRVMLRRGCVIDAYEEAQKILDLIQEEKHNGNSSKTSKG